MSTENYNSKHKFSSKLNMNSDGRPGFLLRIRSGINLQIILAELMHDLIMMSVLLLFVSITLPGRQVHLIVVFALSCCLAFLFRLAVVRIWSYFAALALCVGIPLLQSALPDTSGRLASFLKIDSSAASVLIFGLIAILVRSFVIRLRKADEIRLRKADERKPTLFFDQVPALVIIILLNIVAAYYNLDSVSQSLFYVMILHFILTAWRWHAWNLSSHMARFTNRPTQPAARIRRYNQLLFAVYALTTFALLILSPLLGLHRVAPFIGRQALKLLRLIFSLIFTDEKTPEPIPDEAYSQSPYEQMPLPEESTISAIINAIVVFLLNALFYAAVIAAVIYSIFWVYRRFYSNKQNQDVSESLVSGISGDIKQQIKKTGRRLMRPFARSHEEKIRNDYTRLVELLIKQGLSWKSDFSPRQFAETAYKNYDLDLYELTIIYEKARYANGLCGSYDVSRMQTLCRLIRRSIRSRPITAQR